MKFIQCTDSNGNPIWINLTRVQSFAQYGKGTRFNMNIPDYFIDVRETPTELVLLISTAIEAH